MQKVTGDALDRLAVEFAAIEYYTSIANARVALVALNF
jgi:hypothetical protein